MGLLHTDMLFNSRSLQYFRQSENHKDTDLHYVFKVAVSYFLGSSEVCANEMKGI